MESEVFNVRNNMVTIITKKRSKRLFGLGFKHCFINVVNLDIWLFFLHSNEIIIKSLKENIMFVPTSSNLARRWRIRLERLPRKRKTGCSNPSSDWPKSLKQVETATLPMLDYWCMSWRWPIQTDVQCHSRCGTLKHPHCLMPISASHWSKFAAFCR